MTVNKEEVRSKAGIILDEISPQLQPDLLSPSRMFFRKGKGFLALNFTAVKAFRDCIATLLAEKMVADNFSKEYIEKILEDAILDMYNHLRQGQNKTKVLKEHVDHLIKKLTMKGKDWYVTTPIVNLELSLNNFSIGTVRFFHFGKQEMQKWETRLDDILEKNPTVDEQQKQEVMNHYRQSILPKFKDRVCAKTVVDAAEPEKAQKKATREISEVLNVLRMYKDLLSPKGVVKIGFVGEIHREVKPTLRYCDGKGLMPKLERIGTLFPFRVSQAEITKMQELGLRKLDEIYSKRREKRNEFEKRLTDAIFWFGEGVTDDKSTMKFIKSCFALESLLLRDPNEPVQNNISERLAFIIGTDLDGRRFVKKEMKKLYRLRSDIVHGRQDEVTEGELNLLERFTRSCLISFCNEAPFMNFTNDSQLFEWVEEKKLSF